MKASRLLTMLPLAAMMLVACGPDTSTNTEPKPSENPATSETAPATSEDKPVTSDVEPDKGPFIKEPTKITFWNTFSYSTEIENIIKKFKEIEPNVTVENKKQTGSYTDLKDMTIKGIPANNYPDLVVAYPDHVAEYIDLNVAVDLNDYMDNKSYGWTADEKADIVPNFLKEGQEYPVPGTYSLPMAKSTEAMFYNEKLLGIVIPEVNGGKAISHEYLNNLTWEEMFNVLAPALIKYNDALPETGKIYKTDLEFHGILGYDSDDNLFITLAKQYGYGYTSLNEYGEGQLDFNNPGMKGLMKTFNDAYKKGYIITKGTANKKHPNDFFVKENCLFSIGSTGGVKYQKSDIFDVGVARIPHAAGKDPYVINQGPSVAVLDHKDQNRVLATWLFYKFLTNETNSLYWATATGYMPIRLSGYEDDLYLEYSSTAGKDPKSLELLTAKNAAYVGTVTNELFTSAVFKGSSQAREECSSVMTRSLTEKNCTDEFLDGIFQNAIDQSKLAM